MTTIDFLDHLLRDLIIRVVRDHVDRVGQARYELIRRGKKMGILERNPPEDEDLAFAMRACTGLLESFHDEEKKLLARVQDAVAGCVCLFASQLEKAHEHEDETPSGPALGEAIPKERPTIAVLRPLCDP